MPPCDNGTRAGLRPVPFGLPGSIPGGGVLKKFYTVQSWFISCDLMGKTWTYTIIKEDLTEQ